MTNLDGCEITFPIVGGIFGVGLLATKLKALADTEQIGPWHIGQWTDFNILQSECDSPPLRMVSAREKPVPAQQTEFASVLMTAHVVLGGPAGCSQTVSTGAWVLTAGEANTNGRRIPSAAAASCLRGREGPLRVTSRRGSRTRPSGQCSTYSDALFLPHHFRGDRVPVSGGVQLGLDSVVVRGAC